MPEDLRYVLGLLKFKLLTYRFRFIGKLKSAGMLEYFWNSISKLPIRRIAPTDPSHQRMVDLVQRMIDLHAAAASARTAHEQSRVERQLRLTSDLIDDLTFQLYGLASEEADIVKAALAQALSDDES